MRKFNILFRLLLESNRTPYGYWIDRDGNKYDVESMFGHDDTAKRYFEDDSEGVLNSGYVRVVMDINHFRIYVEYNKSLSMSQYKALKHLSQDYASSVINNNTGRELIRV